MCSFNSPPPFLQYDIFKQFHFLSHEECCQAAKTVNVALTKYRFCTFSHLRITFFIHIPSQKQTPCIQSHRFQFTKLKFKTYIILCGHTECVRRHKFVHMAGIWWNANGCAEGSPGAGTHITRPFEIVPRVAKSAGSRSEAR